MKIPRPDEVTSRDEARDMAVEWQHWQAGRSMSWGEAHAWEVFFTELAGRFDLIEEFAENAITGWPEVSNGN